MHISALETTFYEIPNPGLYSLLGELAAKKSMLTGLRFRVLLTPAA
jgi:hypothetical protein